MADDRARCRRGLHFVDTPGALTKSGRCVHCKRDRQRRHRESKRIQALAAEQAARRAAETAEAAAAREEEARGAALKTPTVPPAGVRSLGGPRGEKAALYRLARHLRSTR